MGNQRVYTVDLTFTTSPGLTQEMAQVLWRDAEHFRAVAECTYRYSTQVLSFDPIVATVTAGRSIELALRDAGVKTFSITKMSVELLGAHELTLVPSSTGEQG